MPDQHRTHARLDKKSRNLLRHVHGRGWLNRALFVLRTISVLRTSLATWPRMLDMLYSASMALDWTRLFNRYKGKWVALADDETTVLAAAPTAKEALAAGRLKGIDMPLLYRVPDSLDVFAGYEIRL